MKCLLGIDPEKTQKCKPSECASCGWEAAEAARRREYVKEHGLTLCADGFRRLIIKKENDMATPYKECPHCGAHLDSGEKCDCRAAEAARRREYVKEHGLTLCADGFRRLIIRKENDMATPYKECPHCGAHLDSGEKCECRAEEIETVHSQKCTCGLTEQDVESGWECPLDNPNETVERCEDCAFAKETD